MYPALHESEHWPPLGWGVLHVPLPPLVGTEPPRLPPLSPLTGLIRVHSARKRCMSVPPRYSMNRMKPASHPYTAPHTWGAARLGARGGAGRVGHGARRRLRDAGAVLHRNLLAVVLGSVRRAHHRRARRDARGRDIGALRTHTRGRRSVLYQKRRGSNVNKPRRDPQRPGGSVTYGHGPVAVVTRVRGSAAWNVPGAARKRALAAVELGRAARAVAAIGRDRVAEAAAVAAVDWAH
jgi:hypothetical protein